MEMVMRTINMKEARACLGHLVDGAERGETVVITRHGKQSARLMPMPARAKGLPSLGEFRSGIAKPRNGLSAGVLAARREERF
jgi:prevent-host-death family protein